MFGVLALTVDQLVRLVDINQRTAGNAPRRPTGVSHPPVSRRSVGNTSKQPYFHLDGVPPVLQSGIQSAIQGKWVFTRRIEGCAKPQAPGVSQAALVLVQFFRNMA